jgi:hypothetical protein
MYLNYFITKFVNNAVNPTARRREVKGKGSTGRQQGQEG